jgi:hypothetical protein
MWPITLPQTKVVHLLRLAWVPIQKRIRRIRQRDGNDSLRYQAYRLRIQSEYVKGMETTRRRYQAYRLRISYVSTVRSGSTRQTDRLCFEG